MGRDMYSIGDFSKMCRLTVKALRLYDEEGILRPGYTDPGSGYRYYSSAQLPEANLVRMLRSLDMPLEEIKRLIGEQDEGRRTELLEGHRSRVEARMDRDRSILDSLMRLATRKGEMMERNIETKDLPEQPILGIRFKTSMANIAEDIGRGYGTLFSYVGRAGVQPVGPPFAMYFDTEYKEEDVDMACCVPVAKQVEGEGEVEGSVLPACKVVSTLHAGAYDTIGETYQALRTWMDENGMSPAGPCREVYLTDPNQVEKPEDNRTEVVWPVEVS